MKKNKIYCIYCGKSNDIDNDKCKFCGKNLKEKEHEFLDFVIDETKGQIKGTFFDKLIAFSRSLITKHLYGTVLTMSVIVASTTTITNVIAKNSDFLNSDINITSDKFVFNELSDEEKLTGCWVGHSNIPNDATYYIKYYDNEKFVRATVYDNEEPTYISGYYIVFDEEIMGKTYTNLYFGPIKVVEAQSFYMEWVDDDTYRYGELGYFETRYERIKCEDFPQNNENDK